jgi:hypothetical protein
MDELPADAGLIAAALVAEMCCEEGLIDRDLLLARAMGIAEAAKAPPQLASGMREFALVLAERRAARLFPRARTARPGR